MVVRSILLSLTLSLTLSLMLVLSAPARALDPGDLPMGTQWYLHVDVQALLGSQMGQAMIEHAEGGPDSEHARQFRSQTGIDPHEDIHQFAVFHDDYTEHEAVMLLRGSFEVQAIEDRIAQAREHESVQVADEPAHRFELRGRHGEQMVYAVVREDWLALSSNRRALAEAVRVITGEQAGLDAQAELLAPAMDGGYIQGGAIDLDQAQAHHSPMINAVQAVHFAVGERADALQARGWLHAGSEQEAEQLLEALQGMKALVQLRDPDSPQARAAEALTLERDERVVSLDFSAAVEAVEAMLDEMPEHRR